MRATSREPWRLILDPPGPPAWNMAVDEVLLRRHAHGEDAPPTLRLYGWAPAAISIGRRQAAITAAEVVVVRRPTGGQAVLHDDERTYAVAGALRRAPFPGGVLDTYRRVAGALVAGLRELGIDVRAAAAVHQGGGPVPLSCFDTLGAHEIAWRGRKLVGSAQVRSRGGFLQHGSLPRTLEAARLAALLGQPVDAGRFVDLSRALGRAPADAEIDAAIVAGFEAAFGCAFARDELTEAERRAAREIVEGAYSGEPSAGAPSALGTSDATTTTGSSARPSAPRS